QVSSQEAAWLADQTRRGAEAQVVAHVVRTPAAATNVVASLRGADPELPPLIVMTPRSGRYWCASERGGGIACWLEVMRALRGALRLDHRRQRAVPQPRGSRGAGGGSRGNRKTRGGVRLGSAGARSVAAARLAIRAMQDVHASKSVGRLLLEVVLIAVGVF